MKMSFEEKFNTLSKGVLKAMLIEAIQYLNTTTLNEGSLKKVTRQFSEELGIPYAGCLYLLIEHLKTKSMKNWLHMLDQRPVDVEVAAFDYSMVEDFTSPLGESLKDTAEGQRLKRFFEKLQSQVNPMIEPDQEVIRREDMSTVGSLSLTRQPDGDMILVVKDMDGTPVCIEFCTSGGKSPNTLQALYNLQAAMQKDNNLTN